MSATIKHTPAGGVILKTPYLQEFVSDLKREIPQRHRSWDPEAKVWQVDSFYADIAADIFFHHFPDGEEINLTGRPSERVPPPSWCLVLGVLPTAPKEVVTAAYKALSKLHHPDTGNGKSDPKKMAQINVAMEEARKHLKNY